MTGLDVLKPHVAATRSRTPGSEANITPLWRNRQSLVARISPDTRYCGRQCI